MKAKLVLAILIAVIIIESTALVLPHLASLNPYKASNPRTHSQSVSYPFSVFNRPVTNNTEHELDPVFPGSWSVDIDSSLMPWAKDRGTEAEMAFAPAARSESHSIPTIIVQERADGLLRVEYFEQSWPNTYGLVLYNSTSPGWTRGINVTIVFRSFGPPSPVDPQVAPRANGNLDILIGGSSVISSYPIAWANLSEVYLYGYPGSSFSSGSMLISFYEVSSG